MPWVRAGWLCDNVLVRGSCLSELFYRQIQLVVYGPALGVLIGFFSHLPGVITTIERDFKVSFWPFGQSLRQLLMLQTLF